VFRWTETNGTCAPRTYDVTIDYNEDPSGADAGVEQELCGVLTTTLGATPHNYQGSSDHAGSTTLWSYVSGPDMGPFFSDPTSPTSDVTVTVYGTYVFRWTEINGTCTSSDTVVIWFDPTPDISTVSLDDVLCNNTSTNIDFSTTTSPKHSIRYTWTVSDPSGQMSGESNSVGNGNSIDQNIQQLLINNDVIAHEVVYTITPYTTYSDNSLHCVGNPIIVTIWVNPTPDIDVIASDSVLCNGETTVLTITNPNNPIRGTWMYNFEVTADLEITGASGSQTGITTPNFTETLINSDTIVHKVEYRFIPRITPDDFGAECPSLWDTTITIWVNPTPAIRVNADTVICTGETATINIRNPNIPIRGTWAYDLDVIAEAEIDGERSSDVDLALTILNETLTNNDTVVHYVDYVFTSKIYNDDGAVVACTNGDTTIRIWVNPTPDIDVIASDSVLCNGETTVLTITNPNNPIRGTWMYNLEVTADSEITGASGNQTGITTPNFTETLINSDTIVHKVEYRFIPRITPDDLGAECPSLWDTTITIWVNPTPAIRISADTVICDGETATINIRNPNNPIRGAWSYDLLVVAQPEIGGERASASDLALTNINETLTNSDTVVHYVDYTFTSKILNDDGAVVACANGDTTIRIWVNPTPEIRVNIADTVICNGETANITVRNPNNPIRGTWMYDLDVTADPEISGELADQTGVTTASYAQTLTNNDTIVHRVVYHFTPRIAPDDFGAECANARDTTITIWVNPTPEIRVVASDSVLCNGETTILTITNPNNPIRGTWLYNLEVTADSEITGATGNQTGVITPFFSETLTNSDTVVHKVEYRFIPRIAPDDMGPECGNPRDTTITIWVNPTPAIWVSADTVICDGETAIINIANPNNPIRGDWRYDLVVVAEPEIDGETLSDVDLDLNVLNETLVNNDTVVHYVDYTFTPKIYNDDGAAVACTNGDTTIRIWVNPTPWIRVSASDSVLCNGDTTVLTVVNPNIPVRGTWMYDLDVTADPEISGATGDQTGVTTPNFTETLTNSDTVVHRVWYHFTPRIAPDDMGAECSNPRDTTIVIWVNPTPEIRVSTDTVICTGETVDISIRNPNTPIYGAWRYDLDVFAEPEIGGARASDIDLAFISISETLTNSDSVAHYVDYTFTPKIYNHGGLVPPCTNGDTTIRIWVNPTPQIRVSADTVICNGETSTITVRNPNDMVQGTWVYDLVVTAEPEIEGERLSENGLTLTSIPEMLTNTDTVVHYVRYHFTPRVIPGDGDPDCGSGRDTTITIWVNPRPEIRVSADTVICNGETATITVRNPNNPIRGTWRYDMVVTADPEISGAIGDQVGVTTPSYSETLTNSDTVAHKVEYLFTPWIHPDDFGADCGDSRDTLITIWVNPTASIAVTAPDTVLCTDEDVSFNIRNPNQTINGEWKYNLVVDYGTDVSGLGIGGEYVSTDIYLLDHLENFDTVAHAVSYHFTPRITPGDGGLDCGAGLDTIVWIWVNPTPEIRVNVPDTVICNEDFVDLFVRNPNVPVMGDWEYNLSVDYGAYITGDGIGGDYDAGDLVLTDQLTNSDTMYHYVEYTFTPRISPIDLGPDCENGRDTIIRVWVNPTPAIRVRAQDSILCNGVPAVIEIFNPNRFVGGEWEYNLVVNPDPEISGARSSVDGITDTLLIDPLINLDTIVHKVEYTFTPTKTPDPDVCAGGNDTTIVIWVNPTPEVRVTVSDTVLCDGDDVTLELRNPNVPIRGDWEGTLEIIPEPGIGGILGLSEPFVGNATYGPYTLTNSDNVARSVTFIFTPRIQKEYGGGCDNGIADTIVVWVNPVPDITVTATDTLICNEEFAQFKIDSENPSIRGEWYYALEVDADPEISGARANNIYPIDSVLIEDLLFNTDTIAHIVSYRFIPRIGPSDFQGDCENGRDTTITIWVNPTPRIFVDFPDTIFCNNDTAVISVLDGLGFVYGQKEYVVTADFTNVTVISRTSGVPETLLVDGTPISDIYINNTLEAQPVDYTFTPRIRDNRTGHEGEFCSNGDIRVRIWINPTPGIDVDVPDTIICDNNNVLINVSTTQGAVMGGTLVYELDVNYDAGSVSGSITGDGELLPSQSINDLLINDTDTVQLITYRFTARIRDDRPGHNGSFCDNGSDTIIYIYLNPTPRLSYLLSADTLCHTGGFELETDSLTYATHQHYYDLSVTNHNPELINVIGSQSRPVLSPLNQLDLYNPGDSVGTITYLIHPYIFGEGCPGVDTTITIKVNPEPKLMIQDEVIPWAVCHDSGYVIPMSTPTINTTGDLRYNLYTDGYNVANMVNVQPDNDYFIADMDQTTVLNQGDSIEHVTYHFLPVIRNTGPAGFCEGSTPDSIIEVQVAPELRGSLVPDTSYVGPHQVRCYGLEDVFLHSNVRGGYYRNPYDFDWDTNGGTASNMVLDDSTQTGMGIGEYWFEVEDIIGCYFSDTITLTQPDTIDVTALIVDASCAADGRNDGSIDITPTGGITGYAYDWTGPFSYTNDEQDVIDRGAGRYDLILNDTNLCEYTTFFWIGSAEIISIDTTVTNYGNYQIDCFGASTGEINVTSISGGFADYTLVVEDDDTGIEVFNQPVTASGALVSGLPAGRYRVWAYDQVGCYNLNQANTTNTLTPPQPISINRLYAQYYHDTVDVSCFDEDDGFIDIEVFGGHTPDYENTFTWTGPDPDLVTGDSIQGTIGSGLLSGGTYNVHIEDFWGCEQWGEYTLYEPTPIVLQVDSVRELNGWNITCFGDNDGFIEISSSGGVVAVEHDYLWSPGMMALPDPSQQDIYDLVADTFHLTITDDIGCTFDTVFDIIEPNVLGLDTIIPRINGWEIACAYDSTGQITLIPLGGADSTLNTYLWSTDTGNLGDINAMNQSNLSEGNYTVRVTDINGCPFEATYELLDPDPILIESLTADSAYCAGTASGKVFIEVSGGVDPFVFLWGGPDGYSSSEADSITDLYAGVYDITLTDDNLCVKNSLIEVFEADHFDVFAQVSSDYSGAMISCADSADGAIQLEPLGGTEPYSYQWNTGATSRNLSGLPAGSYRVVVVDVHGCTDSAAVILDDPLPIDYSMNLEDPLCFGDSTGQIDLLVTGGTVYSVEDYDVWVNELLSGPYVSDLPEGEYQIRIMDLNDCYTETEAELFNPPILEISFDTEDAFCPDKADGEINLYVDGGIYPYNIEWNMVIPDNEDFHNELLTGEYVATVTDANLCIISDSVFVGFIHKSCLVIPNAFSPNGDGFNDNWIIEGLELYHNVEMRIFDRWGSRVYYSPNASDNPWDGTFDGRHLPIDSYHYVIDLKNDEDIETGNVTIVR